MSSPEMDTFDMSDREMQQLLNPLRHTHRQSKKQAIYGMFASDDSGSDEERTGFGGRGSGRFSQKSSNFSAPIAFVSGGVKGGDKQSDLKSDDLPISDDEIGESERQQPDSDSDSSMPETEPKKIHRISTSTFRGRRRVNVSALNSQPKNSGFGAWERHTRGIGMKLLEQMGYQPGKGLGSEGQGITTPVQAAQRVGKEAVGFYGSEVAPKPMHGSIVTESSDSTAEPRYKKRAFKATKSAPSYKTVEEIVASISPATSAVAVKRHGFFLENSEMSKVKVIDMTSKEQRVYTGYEAALSRAYNSGTDGQDGPDADKNQMEKRVEGRRFDCPALRYNLGLILRSCEEDIRKRDRVARHEEDHCVALEHEIDSLSQVVTKEKVEARSLKIAIELLSAFEEEAENVGGGLTPEGIASWLDRVRKNCSGLPEMSVIMAAIARPMLDASLKKWKPLSDPAYCSQLMTTWRDRLQDSLAFDVVLETSWLSTLRRTIVNEWDPRNCEPLLEVIEHWRPLLSDKLFENRILDSLVLPKLKEAVTAWNPLTDTIPIHTWLHPWLPWFGGTERLNAVHECVLHKLASCLSNWHPSDSSAHSILTPWRSVLAVSSLSAFLNRNIVPKLALALQQFKLNPAAQNLECWNWVTRWVDLAGPAVIVRLLEQYFWPRWLNVLSNWLVQGVEARKRGDQNAASQVYQEVGRWYAGWKGQIPAECIEYASVKDALTKALAMMERAMRGLPPQDPQQDCYPVSTTRPVKVATSFPVSTRQVSNLRQQVEQVATFRGLNFHPIPNRFYEGQQVYRLEHLSVFFDRNVPFLHNPLDGSWYPISFLELLSKIER